MADEAPVRFQFEGNASQLLSEVKKIADSLNHLETEVKTHAKMAAVHAVAMGNAMSEGGEKILEWGKEALKSYNEVAGGTRELKNILGGTAEDMSRLRFAGAELGVSTSSISHAMLMAATHMERGDKIAKQFGVSLKDASGKTKPSIQLFGEMADRLMSIQDPLKRNAAGLEMFGRGYRDMIPLLKRGSEGIKELGDESDRLGLTMSQKDLDSTKQFGLAVKQLKANLEGVMVTVGRHLIPILGGLVKIFSEAVSWVRGLFQHSAAFRGIMEGLGVVIATVGGALLIYLGIVKAAAVAEGVAKWATELWNESIKANPIGALIAIVMALIGVIIWLVKTFKPVGDIMIDIAGILGEILGPAIGAIITMFKILADTALSVVQTILTGIGWLASGLSWITGGIIDVTDTIDKWGNSIKSAKDLVDKTMGNWADVAFTQGGTIGRRLGQGLVDAIKSLKMPGMDAIKSPDLAPTDINLDPNAGKTPKVPGGKGSAGGAKEAVNTRKQAILDFFKQLVEASYSALQSLIQKAKDIKQQMSDMGKQIGGALNSAFSITDVSGSTFAQYLGPQALIGGFQKRLADMREFVSNLRSLIKMGLPKEMLLQIANAGVSGGAATAKMLVQHPEIMSDLRNIQKEINQQTTAAGEMVSQGAYGADLASAEKAATDFQKVYNRRLGQAQSIGYAPTQEQLNASTTNIHNEVNMINNITDGNPAAIEKAVAWALKTGTSLGMGPAGAGGGGGGGGGGVDHSPPYAPPIHYNLPGGHGGNHPQRPPINPVRRKFGDPTPQQPGGRPDSQHGQVTHGRKGGKNTNVTPAHPGASGTGSVPFVPDYSAAINAGIAGGSYTP